jgi:chloramphenicol-sensitive protein RarD
MSQTPEPDGTARRALAAGFFCYLIWGWVPLYFQALGRAGVDPYELLAQRTAWGVLASLALVLAARQWPQVVALAKDPRTLGWLLLSSLLIAGNWLVYIIAVNNGRVLEGALGYYINPLINMAAGALLFRERINRIGLVSIALASVGVILQAVALGRLPLTPLALAFSFAAYGVVRKQINAEAQTGLFIECLFLGVPGALYALWLQAHGGGHFGNLTTALLLVGSGIVTVTPLALFSWAARRMPLSTMGFLQFLGPTIGFFIGVAQGEAFTPMRAASFACIWAAALMFAYGAWRATRTVAPVVQA